MTVAKQVYTQSGQGSRVKSARLQWVKCRDVELRNQFSSADYAASVHSKRMLKTDRYGNTSLFCKSLVHSGWKVVVDIIVVGIVVVPAMLGVSWEQHSLFCTSFESVRYCMLFSG